MEFVRILIACGWTVKRYFHDLVHVWICSTVKCYRPSAIAVFAHGMSRTFPLFHQSYIYRISVLLLL